MHHNISTGALDKIASKGREARVPDCAREDRLQDDLFENNRGTGQK